MKDLTRRKFGRLIVLKRNGTAKDGHVNWLCLCKCGTKTIIQSNHLQYGNVKSCGCLHKELTIKRSLKHGHCKDNRQSRIYNSWSNMIKRCTNSNFKSYKNYGGRGIKVCKRWSNKENGFENFLKDMGNRPKGKSIDRINNNENYNKRNCKWSTPKEQSNNKRNNKRKEI